MDVYDGPIGRRRLVGRAEVRRRHGAILVTSAAEQYAIREIPVPGPNGLRWERVILLSPGQAAESLPGWRPVLQVRLKALAARILISLGRMRRPALA